MTKEVMQQALEALEGAINYTDSGAGSLSVTRQCVLAIAALESAIAQPVQPIKPNDNEVICPACCHQFRAIPQGVQRLMLDAGFEPPFTKPEQPAPHNLQKRLADLHLYEEIAEHYAKCAVSPEALRNWVAAAIRKGVTP